MFCLIKTSTIHISNFCSGMPLRKVHELAFLWFGLPGPVLTITSVRSAPLCSMSLIKSLRNSQICPRVTTLETTFGGYSKRASNGPSSRAFAYRCVLLPPFSSAQLLRLLPRASKSAKKGVWLEKTFFWLFAKSGISEESVLEKRLFPRALQRLYSSEWRLFREQPRGVENWGGNIP